MTSPSSEYKTRLAQAFLPIMHMFHHLAGEVVKLTDFSLAQYRVLMLVYRHGSLSISELKTRLNIAQSTASEMIDRLVHQKFLYREKDTRDRRITLFSLTPRSEKLIQQHLASITNIYHEILEPLSDKEQEKLVTGFETILKLLQKSQADNRTFHIS
jgi:DNA-binding MarR family transcriptional regulator